MKNCALLYPMSDKATQLASPRLVLRRARADDLDAIHRIMSDDETMLHWSTPPHATREQTRLWLDSMILADPALSDDFILEEGGDVIGKLGAWKLPEIGFFLRRDRIGQGLASEALDLFVRYIASRNVPFLTADVDPLNLSSLKLLKRAGFVETGTAAGTFAVGNRLCDSVYLRLDLHPPLDRNI